MGNLLLLLVGFWLFTSRLLTKDGVAFYALLFVLFLWGQNAWFFSGFLHFNVLPFVLPYPSTFAKALVFVGLVAHMNFLERGDRRWLLPVFMIGTVVALTHPQDVLFLYVGLGALAITSRTTRVRINLLLTLAVSTVSFIAALLWPYFSFYGLLFGSENVAYRTARAATDQEMYVALLQRVWPGLLVLPFVVRRFSRAERDPLIVLLFGLLILYAYGWRSQDWSYGRLISAIMIVAAIILAEERAEAANFEEGQGRQALFWIRVSTVGLLVVGALNTANSFGVLPASSGSPLRVGWRPPGVDMAKLSDFLFLSRFAGRGEVVMADMVTALQVPTFGGRSVAVAWPEAFIETGQRSLDVALFFDSVTSDDVRRDIICRYRVSFLLVTRAQLISEPAIYEPLLVLGVVRYRSDRFVLVDLRRPDSISMPGFDDCKKANGTSS